MTAADTTAQPTPGTAPRRPAPSADPGTAVRFARNRAGTAGLAVLALFAAAAVLTPWITPDNALSVTDPTGEPFQPPSAAAPFGTDTFGRSVLDLVLWGSRTSLTVGAAATVLSVAIGTLAGITAGHFGGWAGSALMRITDWFLVLPTMVLAIALATVLGRSLATTVIAIGVTAWPTTARLVRAQTLAVEGRPYIERAVVLGGGHRQVMARHVLPAVLPLVMAQTTLIVSGAIIAESTLAFLGLGDPTAVSWGGTLQAARESGAVSAGMWWYLLPPGLAIAAVALSCTLVGRALEAALDPRGETR